MSKNKSRFKVGLKWLVISIVPFLLLFVVGLWGAVYGIDSVKEINVFLSSHKNTTLTLRVLFFATTIMFLPELASWRFKGQLNKVSCGMLRLQLAVMFVVVELGFIQGGFKLIIRAMV